MTLTIGFQSICSARQNMSISITEHAPLAKALEISYTSLELSSIICATLCNAINANQVNIGDTNIIRSQILA